MVSTIASGGCLKRAVARANLTRIVRGHIITPQQFYEFCRENVKGVTVLWCSEDDINLLMQEKLSERYATAKKVTGTLQYHHFSVIRGTSNVEARIMSGDDIFSVHKTCTSMQIF